MLSSIRKFRGVGRIQDSTDQKLVPIESAEGVVLRPMGGFSRAPGYARLWNISSVQSLRDSLSLTSADQTCCIKLVNEGETFLVFYDFLNDLGLGIFYAGQDSEFTGVLENAPTLTAGGAVKQVLWKGLSPRIKWSGALISGRLYMGNGVDPNLVYDVDSNTIGMMGSNIAPLAPTLQTTNPVTQTRLQSRLETAGLRLSADKRLAGAEGNYIGVTVCGGEGNNFSSRLTGQGTFCDPFDYIVFCPNPLPTNLQLAQFIQRDPNASGIVQCEYLASSPGTAPLFPQARLAYGQNQQPPYHSGASADGGTFESAYSGNARLGVRVLLTYIRRDERLGIVESAPSPMVMVETAKPGYTARAVKVDVSKDEDSSEAQNWTGIRVYASEVCLDCVCSRKTQWLRLFEISNETTQIMIYPWHVNARARDDKTREGLLIEEDVLRASRPPEPAKKFVFANDRIYMMGNSLKPLRIYYTAERSPERPLIETTSEKLFYDFVPQGAGSGRVRDLAEFQGRVMAFAGRTAYDPFAGVAQTVTSPPLNHEAGVHRMNGSYYYLGQDFNLYRVDSLPNDSTTTPLEKLVSSEIAGHIRDYTDLSDDVLPHSAVDEVNQIWWIWVRAEFGGMAAFAFDFREEELTGPFYFPPFVSVASISPADGRWVGLTPRGELFVWNLRKLAGTFSKFDNTAGVSLVDSTSTSFSAGDYQGFSVLFLKNGKSILKGHSLRLKTGWMDFGSSAMKGFYEFRWSVVKNSSGVVCISLETDTGGLSQVYYGEVFGKDQHKILTLLSGTMLRAVFTVWVEDDKDFAVRDWTVMWREQGN